LSTTLSHYEMWYGCDQKPTETRELRAGPITAQLAGGDLSSRDRAAAILILVFGQQIEDVVGATLVSCTLVIGAAVT
jgi:hypothetical protein